MKIMAMEFMEDLDILFDRRRFKKIHSSKLEDQALEKWTGSSPVVIDRTVEGP